jgi:hypothetical protein
MTNPSKASEAEGKSESINLLHTAALVLAIVLCTASCALMFTLSPRSIAVDSVYQGF